MDSNCALLFFTRQYTSHTHTATLLQNYEPLFTITNPFLPLVVNSESRIFFVGRVVFPGTRKDVANQLQARRWRPLPSLWSAAPDVLRNVFVRISQMSTTNLGGPSGRVLGIARPMPPSLLLLEHKVKGKLCCADEKTGCLR